MLVAGVQPRLNLRTCQKRFCEKIKARRQKYFFRER